jgi:hypothetical protein
VHGGWEKANRSQEFRSLCNHEKCSEFLADLLEFVEKRMLRMGPKKRAGCDEIVHKFADLHRMCSEDLDYCTKRLQVPPHRAATDLSVLKASALDFSPEMDKRIKRAGLPEHTGPLEHDYHTPDAEEDGNGRNSNSNEIVGPINEVKATTGGKQLNSVASISSDTESQNSRPQSSNKKVHFSQNLQPPSQGTSKPEPSTDASESEQENQTNFNPNLRDGKSSTSAVPESSNVESTERFESRITPIETTDLGIDITEPAKQVNGVARHGEQKDISEETRQKNALQTSGAIEMREKHTSRWRRFSCCCSFEDG